MNERLSEPGPTRAEIWDARHATQGPIESSDADPTLVQEVAAMTPGVALDLGAGDGRNAVWLAGHGWRVPAVDFSIVAIDRGRALATDADVEIEWRREDLLAWTPATAAFDLVALFFIHLPRDERRVVYERAASAVKLGGTILVVGHDHSNLRDGLGGPQNPDVLFTPADIARDLPARFTIIRAETVRRPGVPLPAPIDAIVRAVRSA